mgnify:CR=1 FL=1
MDKFVTHTGIAVALNRANVDTDAIIPKQFLKSIKRTGFGEHLFDAGGIALDRHRAVQLAAESAPGLRQLPRRLFTALRK